MIVLFQTPNKIIRQTVFSGEVTECSGFRLKTPESAHGRKPKRSRAIFVNLIDLIASARGVRVWEKLLELLTLHVKSREPVPCRNPEKFFTPTGRIRLNAPNHVTGQTVGIIRIVNEMPELVFHGVEHEQSGP
jgi:hypothetical protein